MANSGWVGFDLDGTTAEYEGFKGPGVIGNPVPRMIAKIKWHIAQGHEVRIFTARVWTDGTEMRNKDAQIAREAILVWTEKHIGIPLKSTCMKDYSMWLLYDDRCKQVVPNTGRIVGDDDHLVTPRTTVEAVKNSTIGIHWTANEAIQLKAWIDANTEIERSKF